MNDKSALEKWQAMRDACLETAGKLVPLGEDRRVQSLVTSASIAEQAILTLKRSTEPR